VLGFGEVGRDSELVRFMSRPGGTGSVVDLKVAGNLPRGRLGGGGVHHVAFRATDDAAQAEMVRKLAEALGLDTTEQKDRKYFRSVYFREPGGVLFEIATDAPGFTVDEPADGLGQALKLPAFLEPDRRRIESSLPALGKVATTV
jgi:glyoxalase family protein